MPLGKRRTADWQADGISACSADYSVLYFSNEFGYLDWISQLCKMQGIVRPDWTTFNIYSYGYNDTLKIFLKWTWFISCISIRLLLIKHLLNPEEMRQVEIVLRQHGSQRTTENKARNTVTISDNQIPDIR